MTGPKRRPSRETPYMTVIVSRNPREKAHVTRRHAHAALSQRVSTRTVIDPETGRGGWRTVLDCDAALYEWRDGDWRLLWEGKRHDQVDYDARPWKAAKLPERAERVYLAGPMTGIPRWNFDAFAEAAARIRALGVDVVSPHEFDIADGFDPDAPVDQFTEADLHKAMRRDIEAVLAADAVVLLPGWEKSTGARVEADVASAIGTPVYLLDRFLERSAA